MTNQPQESGTEANPPADTYPYVLKAP